MRNAFIFFALTLTCAAQTSLNYAGSVSGSLVGDDGTQIAGGLVHLTLLPPLPSARHLQTEWTATSDSGGAFSFTGLNGGAYRLCAYAPSGPWLDPCRWGLNPPVLSLSVSLPTATLSMTLKKGAAVTIRVNDPGGLLAQNEGVVPGADLLLGVANDALGFDVAPITSQDSGGSYHQLVVPFNSAASLTIFSAFFQLANASGALPKAALLIPLNIPPGQTPPLITISVTGGSQL